MSDFRISDYDLRISDYDFSQDLRSALCSRFHMTFYMRPTRKTETRNKIDKVGTTVANKNIKKKRAKRM